MDKNQIVRHKFKMLAEILIFMKKKSKFWLKYLDKSEFYFKNRKVENRNFVKNNIKFCRKNGTFEKISIFLMEIKLSFYFTRKTHNIFKYYFFSCKIWIKYISQMYTMKLSFIRNLKLWSKKRFLDKNQNFYYWPFFL